MFGLKFSALVCSVVLITAITGCESMTGFLKSVDEKVDFTAAKFCGPDGLKYVTIREKGGNITTTRVPEEDNACVKQN